MKEVMRVAMDAAQIRAACAAFAADRVVAGTSDHSFTATGIDDDASCVVVVTPKRVRKPKVQP